MNDLDALVRAACATPADDAPRLALADALAAAGDDALEARVRAVPGGKTLLVDTWKMAHERRLPLCARLLWGVAFVAPTAAKKLPAQPPPARVDEPGRVRSLPPPPLAVAVTDIFSDAHELQRDADAMVEAARQNVDAIREAVRKNHYRTRGRWSLGLFR